MKALIHRSAWKEYSAKFGCSILHSPGPIEAAAAGSRHQVAYKGTPHLVALHKHALSRMLGVSAPPRSVWPRENRAGLYSPWGRVSLKEVESTVRDDRSVEEMANEVLMRQAKARAERSREPIEEALEAVLNTEAGTQLRELRDVPHDEESVEEWQVGLAQERAQERAEDLGDHLEESPEHPTHG